MSKKTSGEKQHLYLVHKEGEKNLIMKVAVAILRQLESAGTMRARQRKAFSRF